MSLLCVTPDGALYTTGVESVCVEDPGCTCFSCGEQFRPDDGYALFWSGAAGPLMPAEEAMIGFPPALARAMGMVCVSANIHLHAACWVELSARLWSDFHALERQSDGQYQFQARPKVRSLLRRREPR